MLIAGIETCNAAKEDDMAIMLLVCLALEDVPAKVELDKAELKKLQGAWHITTQEHGGKKTSAKELFSLSMVVDGERMTTRDGPDLKEDAKIQLLNPKAKPAAIDLKIASGGDMNKVVKGIWKLQADTLTVCVAEPDKDRPSDFAAKEGTGHTLLVFKKIKKK
jgi:uncharacterized protein (TIGR03067 family)